MNAPPVQVPGDRPGVPELLRRCMAGNDEARAQFYSDYKPLICRAVLSTLVRTRARGTSLNDAEDIAHDVIAKLFSEGGRRFQQLHDPASLHAWLIAIARNQTLSALRSESARDRLQASLARESERTYPSGSTEKATDKDERERLRRVIRQTLSDREKLILDLYYRDELKYLEIAELLRMNINTVTAIVRRSREKLRAALERE